MNEREQVTDQLPVVIIDSKAPIRGPNQQEAYLDTYLHPLLEGRLAVPRKNMRLDWAVEAVVEKCLKCLPKDPEARSILALQIVEKSTYAFAKERALSLLLEQFENWPNPNIEQSQFLQGAAEKLIATSDLCDVKEFKSSSFAAAAKIGGTLVRNSYLAERTKGTIFTHPNYFPILFRSLSDETDEGCFTDKFIAVSGYLQITTRFIRDPQSQEERLNQLLSHTQNRIEAVGPLKAIDLIFSVLWKYSYDCLQGIIFQRPPFDLATLQKICREAPPEQKAEVVNRVRNQFGSLVSNTYIIGLASTREALEALIRYAFPDLFR